MKIRHPLTIAFITITLLCLSCIRLWPRDTLQAQIPSSQVFTAQGGELLRITLAADQQYRVWVPLEDIAPSLVQAVLLYEDRWFYWHPGVNPQALLRAALRTYGYRQHQGGSTLSMQLARLFYGLNTKSVTGKLHQIALALWLELRYSKHDILEAYLNLAPYGSNVQGVGAASLIYFRKTPRSLNLSEALSLAVIPQHPNRRAGNNAFSEALNAPKARLLNMWQKRYPLDDTQAKLASLPIAFHKIQDLPFRAPHFVDMLQQQHLPEVQVRTSLDLNLQTLIERQVRQYLTQQGHKGLQNASALLIDSRTQEVKAWLGSADYFNTKISGQVNGVLAKRSPGSTLKPFIYALALDQGILHPASIIKDSPTDFGPYTPENFDGKFRGPISAQDALIHSRNIPAVWVASQLRKPSLYDFLTLAGVSSLKSESHYGLALVLGGGEVTMEELAGLYVMLANGGRYQSVQYLTQQASKPGPELLSPEASFITLDMLSHNPRPEVDDNFNPKAGWTVAWKTGTSWGFRDAWSVGSLGPYVLAVWIGNFDSRGNPAFVGIDAAAPLFFRIADNLFLNQPSLVAAASAPASLRQIEVCSASGDLPNAWCPHTQKTWYIPGKSPIKVSQLHQPVAVDIASGQALCPPYNAQQVRMEVMEFWSSDMQKLFRQAGLPRRTAPSCQQGLASDPPEISSPVPHVTYQLRRSHPDISIPLQAKAAAQVRTLYWFDGNRYLGRSDPQTALVYRPTDTGTHSIRVVDDQGQATQRDMRVAWSE